MERGAECGDVVGSAGKVIQPADVLRWQRAVTVGVAQSDGYRRRDRVSVLASVCCTRLGFQLRAQVAHAV